ncbi:hypothetical protein [Metapseudomonas resinovorans]|uniref:DUF1652 domain-containing protein n=1 Tax=Metapseudomonas resinovorans NBRC 106553 TaxID=1245471 RepID=S6AR44_METRE|nr:hypothetical protein [Pseudomonas resinovorans]BAN48318.1 hypothetical protein PCA10_25860 [Pseudomonas resinovorans NBRC 106553]
MKRRLQQRLQAEVSEALPGFVVTCEFATDRSIDISLSNQATHEALRITGVQLGALLGPGAFDEMVDQLMFEIRAVTGADRIEKVRDGN